jgi:hypothetical protein
VRRLHGGAGTYRPGPPIRTYEGCVIWVTCEH